MDGCTGSSRRTWRRSGAARFSYSPLGCILSDRTIIQPDLVYLDRQRQSAISGPGIEGVPTLVVEILSPSTAQIDRGVKHQLYARYGVPSYWIADPDARTIMHGSGPASSAV